jgi:hypothetical protein
MNVLGIAVRVVGCYRITAHARVSMDWKVIVQRNLFSFIKKSLW